MTVQEKLYTSDEFWEIAHLPENDEKRMELVEGVIYEMPPAGGEHGEIAANLLVHIWTEVRDYSPRLKARASTARWPMLARPRARIFRAEF